jgi:lipopolysaccharide transport system permease protein
VILYGQLPEWSSLALYYLIAFFVAWSGLMWFKKTRKGFADVL